MKDIILPDEDGVALEISNLKTGRVGYAHLQQANKISIAIVKLPRISNFTDFDAFRSMPDIVIKYVTTPQGLKDLDIVIIPGTKNTLEDLQWLWGTGLADAIIEYREMGGGLSGYVVASRCLGWW